MITVYEKESGKEFKCEPVDVAELVKSGFYVKEKKEEKKESKTQTSKKK